MDHGGLCVMIVLEDMKRWLPAEGWVLMVLYQKPVLGTNLGLFVG